MAGHPMPCYPTSSLPPAVLEQYHDLTEQQKGEQKAFNDKISRARVQLFEKHANEQRRFWEMLPPSSRPVAAVNRTTAPSQGFASVPSGLHQTVQQTANLPPPSSNQNTIAQSAQRKAPTVQTKPQLCSDVSKPIAAQSTIASSSRTTKLQATIQDSGHTEKPKPVTKIQYKRANAPRTHMKVPLRKGAPEIVDLISSDDDDAQLPHVEGKCKASSQLESHLRRPPAVMPVSGPGSKVNHPPANNDKRRGQQGPFTPTVPPSSGLLNGSHSLTLAKGKLQSSKNPGCIPTSDIAGTLDHDVPKASTFTQSRSGAPALPGVDGKLVPTPPCSQVSSRKRKIEHNVSDGSDDTGSNFEPSSNDDEPLISAKKTPIPRQHPSQSSSAKPLKRKSTKFVPFKPMATQPTTPIPASRTGTSHATPKLNSAEEFCRSLFSVSPSVRAASRQQKKRARVLGQRAAKQRAIEKLEEHCQQDAEFFNEEDIRQADELEQRLTVSAQVARELGIDSRLRAMSIIPALSEITRAQQEANDFKKWTDNRMSGDRYLSKNAAESRQGLLNFSNVSPSPDTSSFRRVDGRYILSKDVEKMDLVNNA